MGKILVIKNADFSAVAVSTVVPLSEGMPVISINDSGMVTIEASFSKAIYYTIDGSTPTPESILYSEPFVVANNTIVNAVSVNLKGRISNVSTNMYIKKTPKFSAYYFPLTEDSTDIKTGLTPRKESVLGYSEDGVQMGFRGYYGLCYNIADQVRAFSCEYKADSSDHSKTCYLCQQYMVMEGSGQKSTPTFGIYFSSDSPTKTTISATLKTDTIVTSNPQDVMVGVFNGVLNDGRSHKICQYWTEDKRFCVVIDGQKVGEYYNINGIADSNENYSFDIGNNWRYGLNEVGETRAIGGWIKNAAIFTEFITEEYAIELTL